jgi:uncharacterized protein
MRSSVIGSSDGSVRCLGAIPISSTNESILSLSPSETSKISHSRTSAMSSSTSSDAILKGEISDHDRHLPPITRLVTIVKALPSRLALGLIAFYKIVISPFLGPACRYEPTCSTYAAESLTRFGFLKGGWLATKRICRCHPLSKQSGFDPVPSVHTHVSPLKGSE